MARVKVEYHFGSTTGVGHSNNISEGGIFLVCDRVAGAGTRVYLRLHLPGSLQGDPLKIIGIVIRSTKPVSQGGLGGDQESGMGIHFEVAYARTREALSDFIETILIEGAAPPSSIHPVSGATEEDPEYAMRFPSVRGPAPESMSADEVQQAFAFASDEPGINWKGISSFVIKLLVLLAIVGLAYAFIIGIGS